MIFRVYKSNHPIVIILIVIISVALWIPSIIQEPMEPITYDFEMPLYYYIIKLLSGKPLLTRIIAFMLVLIQAIQINRLNTKFFLIESRSFLPSFIFIISCCITPLQNLHPILFAGVLLLWAIARILSTYRNDKAWINFFDAGIIVSIASLFYIKISFYILIIWLALFILRSFRGREWILSITGFIIPYLFVVTYFYIFEDNLLYKLKLFYYYLFEFNYNFNIHYSYYIFFIILGLLTLLSSFKIIVTLQKRKVSVRRYYQLFFWLFIITFAIFSISSYTSIEIILIANISLAFLISNYFHNIKSVFWTELLMSLFIGSLVLIQISHYTNLLP